MKRGRKPGQYINARDANGWMIPREGSKRRAVYDMLSAGISRAVICGRLALSHDAYEAHREYIINWKQEHVWRKAGDMRECAL